MKQLLLSLCLFAGFFVFSQSGTTVVDSIKFAGFWRQYRLYVPPVYSVTKPAPLVLNLHGLGSNAIQQQYYGNFMPQADTAGFLILMPQGTEQGGTVFWNVGVFPVPDDVGFIRALMDTIASKYTVDNNRVYSTGMSNGAIMTYYLACQLPGRFAAIASVAGTMFRPWLSTCIPATALPVMAIHGDADQTVPYAGDPGPNGSFVAVDSVVQNWRRHNLCLSTAQVINFPDLNTNDLSTAINYRYLQGRDQSTVELIKIISGQHAWPGAPAVLPGTNQDFKASTEIWRFFRQYRRSQFTTPSNTLAVEELHRSGAFQVYPNPCSTQVTVEAEEDAEITVYSLQGQLICNLSTGVNEMSHLKAGLYVLRYAYAGHVQHVKLIKE